MVISQIDRQSREKQEDSASSLLPLASSNGIVARNYFEKVCPIPPSCNFVVVDAPRSLKNPELIKPVAVSFLKAEARKSIKKEKKKRKGKILF